MNSGWVAEEEAQVVENMRARAAPCRRLAGALTDRRAAAVLLKMAEEVEADIARLERSLPHQMPQAPGG